MEILVCIKQVPATSKVEVDPETGVLLRSGAESKMNPYDLHALEAALRLRGQLGGRVRVLTMGPPAAEAVVREAYAMGADEGVLVSDGAFAGADVLATSYTLAQAVHKSGPFDLILCGKQTTDGDTAQVGPELAEWLGLPAVAGARKIVQATPDALTLEVEGGSCVVTVRLPTPCLVAVEKDIFQPRLPSYVKQRESAHRPIRRLSLADMEDTDEAHYGIGGSPTQVRRIFPPVSEVRQEIWHAGQHPLAETLYEALRRQKVL